MPRQAFTAEHLDEELEREARKFLSEERNLRINHKEKTILLSTIFDWYREEFLTWYQDRFPSQKATLVNYMALYLPAEKAKELRGKANSYRVRFIPYDWRLNDQHNMRAQPRKPRTTDLRPWLCPVEYYPRLTWAISVERLLHPVEYYP